MIDGFPRNKENLDGWLNTFGEECLILGVLYLDCPKEVCCDRIMVRMETSGRVDDNQDSLKKRFITFENETLPNLENLKQITTVYSVNSNRSREEVFKDISSSFDTIFSS